MTRTLNEPNNTDPLLAVSESVEEQILRLDSGSGLKPTIQKSRRKILVTKPLLKSWEAFLVPAIILFLTGCAFSHGFPSLLLSHFKISLPLIVMLVGITLASVQNQEKRWLVQGSLWLIALLAGCLFYSHSHPPLPASDVSRFVRSDFQTEANHHKSLPHHDSRIEGILDDQVSARRVILSVQKVDGKPATGKVLADLPYVDKPSQQALAAGRHFMLFGVLGKPFHSSIPGTFNQRDYLAGLGVTATLKKTDDWKAAELSNHWPYPLQRLADHCKTQVQEVFQKALPSPQAEVFGGLVLGDKAIPVDRKTKQAFIDTGLIHLLAASGMNVGIIAWTVFAVLGRLKCPQRISLVIAMVAVAFYGLLTGYPPSIQRAATMLELALVLKLLNRELSSVFLLSVVTLVLVVIHPANIGSIGFQFSVLTTFGLLTMAAPLQDWFGYYTTRWIAGLFLVPFIAQLWITPLSVAYFNRFPIHSVPLNILALILITPLTIMGFVSALFSLCLPIVGGFIASLASPLVSGLLTLANWGESAKWSQWSFPAPEPWFLLSVYGTLFLWLALLNRGKAGRWPSPKAWIIGLLPVALISSGLALQRWVSFNRDEIVTLPLSPIRQAILYKPFGSFSRALFISEKLTYGEARSLSDYLRHTQNRELTAVVKLSGQSVPNPGEGDTRGRNYLTQAFKEARIGHLVEVFPSANDADGKSHEPTAQTSHSVSGKAFEMRIAQSQFRWDGQSGLLFNRKRCLMNFKKMNLGNLNIGNLEPTGLSCALTLKSDVIAPYQNIFITEASVKTYTNREE